jgi:hypothetical protein
VIQLDEDKVWCAPRGINVGVSECHTACVDECQREICWAGNISPSFQRVDEVAVDGSVPVAEEADSVQ